MALPTCECVKGLPIGEQLAAIYCATYTLAAGDVDGPYLLKSANLSDVDNVITSRNNLGASAGIWIPAVGGTGFNAYGNRARVRTITSGVTWQTVPDSTWSQVTGFTNELEDVGGLWNAAASQTEILPAGGYAFFIAMVADIAVWELAVFNDGVMDTQYGKCTEQQPNFSGVFVADGTSIYTFQIRQASGSDKNLYWDDDWEGVVLFRLW